MQDPINDESGPLVDSRKSLTEKLSPVPAPAPHPKLSEADYEKLQSQIEQIKQVGAREGWSTLQISAWWC